MKKNLLKLTIGLLILCFGIAIGIFIRQNKTSWAFISKPFTERFIKFDDTRKVEWSKSFIVVDIKSSMDNNLQKAYFYKSKSNFPKPLIVSLHTWSADYSQNDDLAKLCEQKDLNYIHPNFRGANRTKEACCSELALTDIDDSITFGINNSNVDTTNIFVIGVSGGGYATLCTFMK